ncbi:MAG: GNAT family N-acetyltransferase [Alphaproteobacteria bacterium]
MEIRLDDLSGKAIQRLLSIHCAEAIGHSPEGLSHALPIEVLREAAITFWTAWAGASLMGCGAIRELSSVHGEIKSMHTAAIHRRKGVSSAMLRHILEESRRRGYSALSLETHPTEIYAPARALYKQFGFAECGPFGSYIDNPNSYFMTLKL